MYKKLFQAVLATTLLGGIIFTSGCEDFCGGTSVEPVFDIVYNAGGTVLKVYAVKNGNNLAPVEFAVGTNFELPIDLNATSVSYTFETSQGTKSMQVFYEASTELVSFDCGFRFSIDDPRIGATEFNNPTISGGDRDNYEITIQ